MIEDGEGNDITKGDLMENKRNYEILVPGDGKRRVGKEEELLREVGPSWFKHHKSQESISGEGTGD